MEHVHAHLQEPLYIVFRNVIQTPIVTSVMDLVKDVSAQDDVICTSYAER